MTNALDLSYNKNALDLTKIDSHTSQLTNLRLHELELKLDNWRMLVRQNATQENIIGYYSVLNTLFSYLLTVDRTELISQISNDLKTLNTFWAFVKHNIETQQIQNLKKKYPKTFWKHIETSMITLCDRVADNIRRAYQEKYFYFRTSKVSRITGIEGNLLAIKKKKGEINEFSTSENP